MKYRILGTLALLIAMPIAAVIVISRIPARLRGFWRNWVAPEVTRMTGKTLVDPGKMSPAAYGRWRSIEQLRQQANDATAATRSLAAARTTDFWAGHRRDLARRTQAL